jgi:polyphosphate kinase
MTRNLSHRIETAFPVLDEKLKAEIHEFMEIQWNDNVKARKIEATLSNKFNNTRKKDISIRSQFETYFMVKRLGGE